MTSFKLDVDDAAVQAALGRLAAAVKRPRPALAAIGEALLAQTRRTFEASTDPWGRRWAPNAPATIAALLRQGGGNFGRDGRISARGAARVMAKRPLIGESRFLSGASIRYRAGAAELTLGSSAEYAAIHQFGGQAGRGRKMTIPARPFLPITAAGALAPEAARTVLAILQEHLDKA